MNNRNHSHVAGVALAAALLAGMSTILAQSLAIHYEAVDLDDQAGPGGDWWEYRYSIGNPAPLIAQNHGFSIAFPPDLFRDLESFTTPPNADWDAISLQPVPALAAAGLYDAVAPGTGPSLQDPFVVRFVWLGASGTSPGSQAFEFTEFDAGGNFVGVLQLGTTVSGPAPSALEAWRMLHFGSTQNSGDAADHFDYDKDGIINLIEFAFGTNPTSGGSLQTPSGQWQDGDFVISFIQAAGVNGITYGAEWSSTMEAETWIDIPDTGNGLQHTFRITPTEPQIFIRLRVSTP